MFRFLICFVCLVLSLTFLNGQNPLTFTNFEGPVYRIPKEKVTKGYGSYIDSLEVYGKVNWESIKIPERSTDESFPDVDLTQKFGMVLKSTLKVNEKACYEFILNSDDGSVLWINGQEIINNDGDHKMIKKTKQLSMHEGSYDVKIWYYQAFPTKYGFIFDAKHHAPFDSCVVAEIEKKVKKVVLPSSTFFNSNSWNISSDRSNGLDSLIKTVDPSELKKITIKGHTDSVGTEKDNLDLSLKRAEAVQAHLMKAWQGYPIRYSIEARGESELINFEDTREAHAQNRRVEIFLHFN